MDLSLSHTLYLKSQISTASPEKVMAMLLERCQKAVQDAIHGIEASHPEQRFHATHKALDILSFLTLSVGSEPENELSTNLIQIYTHCIEKLKLVSFKRDLDAACRILEILDPIQKAYRSKADQTVLQKSTSSSDRLSPGIIG